MSWAVAMSVIYLGEVNVRTSLRRSFALVATLLLSLATTVPAFSQGLFATVTGTVTDGTKALIPGVTIKATAVDTGVVSTTLTNDAGSYTFGNLAAGKYTLSASLTGFQTKTITDAQLSQGTSSRFNFEMNVAGAATQVEVTIAADSAIATQGASVGQELDRQKIADLPIVGNNVLDLITVMAGVQNVVATNPPSAANAFGRENTTFAGVRADNVMIVRDGIDMNDNRSPNGVYSITTINPDLVGEVRLILAPVDVELGRGNGSIQYTTRSGTNKFTGSAVWTFRNTALDPNTWANNRSQTVPLTASAETKALAAQGKADLALEPNWTNTQQGTISVGGPIIKNKTFFFGLFDLYTNHMRSLDNFIVLTPCAQQGIIRYFNTWNSTNVLGSENAVSATHVAVDQAGNPLPPSGPASGPSVGYDNSVQYRSLFGPLATMPTNNNCTGAAINPATLVPNGVSVTGPLGTNSGGWDQFRRQEDLSGYTARYLAGLPQPNNYEIGDGLNTAGYRILRRSKGVDNLFGSGEATGIRKQYNAKVDHNFNSNNKANVNFTYERTVSDDVFGAFPTSFSNSNFRHPIVITAGFTTTLSATLLNEARFGYRLQDLNVIAPMALPEDQDALAALFPAPVNGIKVVPFYGFTNTALSPPGSFVGTTPCPLHYGSRPPTNAPLPGAASGCNVSPTSKGKTPTWTFSDTVSWTHGAHAIKFSGELRLNSSKTETPGTGDFVGTSTYATATLGQCANGTGCASTQLGTTGANDFSNSNSRPATDPNNLLGLANTTRTSTQNLMNMLAGSLSNVAMQYYIDSPPASSTPAISDWRDFRNNEYINVTVKQTEFSAWIKDEWKIARNFTITPGLRWDYTGVPYLPNGTTIGMVGGGGAAFGISGRDFTGWMNPGARADATNFQFVGPNSPNPSVGAYPDIWGNFGPSFAFAWTPKMFGEGKTTIRGGYQITYSTGSPQPGTGRFSSYSNALTGAPGRTLVANANAQSGYLDLSNASNTLNPTNLTAILPIAPTVAPLQTQATVGPRNQALSVFDPNYTSPYVQNMTLSVTRNVNRNLTVDLRYIGTLGRKSYATQDLNLNNFRSNGLIAALNAVRAGDDANSHLLDQIFAGVNLCTSNTNATSGGCITPAAAGVASYGPINGSSPGQTAAAQIRAGGLGGNSLANLVNGSFAALAGTISNFNYNWGSGANPHVCAVNCTLPDPNPNNATVGSALRLNGFPDNFVVTNPQFSSVTYYTNWGSNNYHSLQAQTTWRPIQGVSGSFTYSWSRNLGLGNLTDPTNRAPDYTDIGNNPRHEFRSNGTFELPFGPNKLVAGNTSGWVARAIEKWQMGVIYNYSVGAPASITMNSMIYGNGLPDIRHEVDFNELAGVRWGIQNQNNLEGRYFDNGDQFVYVPDPQCIAVTSAQNLYSATGALGASRCTLQALAKVVPAGTPDSGTVASFYGTSTPPATVAADTRTVQIVLQHPQPGQRGNLGNNEIQGLGFYRFDANLGKTFRLSESKSLQVRFDALNVLNHPQPGNPNLNIDSTTAPFGQISGKTGTRTMQGQLRFSF